MQDRSPKVHPFRERDASSPRWQASGHRQTTGLLPVEVIAVVSLLLLVVMPLVFSVRIYFPDEHALVFAAYHYLGPLLPAILLPAVVWVYRVARGRQGPVNHNIRAARTAIAFSATVFVHFNLKLWAQLINPTSYDSTYQHFDHQIASIATILEWLGDVFRAFLAYFPHAYHEVFISMFFISFLVHSWRRDSRVFDHLSASVSLVLLLGGLSYAIAPAIGPFIHEVGGNAVTTAIQTDMLEFHQSFITSGGAQYEPRFFVASLAAMPSLHFAHALTFGYFAFRYTRLLGWIYVLPITYIACDAVSSKWHYLVDLPAGVVVAAISIALASRLASLQPERPPSGCAG
ncbi:MAG: phosphatase PAP2 family protein [Burkholderiaceae bacterium]|nr:phosphatase PAP2 family protein [Sulfuritalea sp.]MCF8176100.1 phosphatase PAP2 family protein [Burkholderiaceae bacterium]